MRALVTGGAGFIGYNLCQFLASHNYNIVVIDDLSSGSRLNIVEGIEYHFCKVQHNCIVDRIIRSHEPEVIFHLAAIPRVAYSVDNPETTSDANIMGTISVLEAVRKSGRNIRVINSSSSSIYGEASQLPTTESCPANPQSPYALQKWQSEEWGRMYASMYGMDVVSLRYFNCFGKYSRYGGSYSTVLSAWLYHLYVDNSVVPYLEGDGLQSRDFCFVDNVVQANHNAAVSKNKFNGESYNISQGDSHSLLECKSLLESISGKNIELEIRPPRKGDVRHTLADINAARQRIKYNPELVKII